MLRRGCFVPSPEDFNATTNMAIGKKSFILYCDIINTVAKLPDEQAGKLFKIILEYVNDNNPCVDDLLLQIAFEPIKQQLKRDLIEWETIREKRVIAGKASAYKRKRELTHVGKCQHMSTVNVNDTVTVTVNDTVNENKKNTFNFKNALIEIGVTEQIASDWMAVRKTKKATNTQTAFIAIKKQIEISGRSANACIEHAVTNNWSGFKAEWMQPAQQQQPVNRGPAR